MINYKKVIPTGDRILVRKDDPEEFSEDGNIAIPERGRTEKFTGVVVASGPDADPFHNVGSRVLFASYIGIEIEAKIKGKEGPYVLLRDADILALVE